MSFIRIKTILGMPPSPFEWLDDNRCVFKIEDDTYGIFVHSFVVEDNYNTVNISFGRISSIQQFYTSNDLDTTLSGTGRPKFILSTVGAACLVNPKIKVADVICLAASDEHSAKQGIVYSIVASEIRQFVPGFSKTAITTVKTETGSLLTLMVRSTVAPEDIVPICDRMNFSKV